MSVEMPAEQSQRPKIRSFTADDHDAVVALWRETGLLVWYNNPQTDLALWQRTESAEVFVAEKRGKIVGTVACGHDGHRGWLYYLAVAPKRHRGGIGRALVHHAERWLLQRDVRKVHVMIRASNPEVRDFYRRCGYETNPVSVMQKWLVDKGRPPKLQPVPKDDGTLDVTITYLEMHQPPRGQLPHPPAAVRLALMRAKKPPVRFYRYLYDSVGEAWLWMDRRKLSDRELTKIIHDDRVEIYVAYADGVPAGFAEIDRRTEGVVELAYFGMMPEFIGKRLGHYLLAWAVDAAWRSHPQKVTVNTCTLDHPKALPLYQKVGFRPVGQEHKVVDDPRLSGLIPFPETRESSR
ncbi:MAG: GNAT family acetyltransferase [Rhodovibrionaceae bacterium]|nr:GNAT family acetyltransferase [Rhodovibrionaceae bacterium]